MKTKLLIAALFLSVGGYAQTTPTTPTAPLTTTQPEMHRNHKAMTPEQRAEFKEEQKAKLAAMTPAERKAFKADMKQKHEARLSRMTPKQREKFEARKQKRKEQPKQNG